jgi:uncharacterized RDD family membrane protein YckC
MRMNSEDRSAEAASKHTSSTLIEFPRSGRTPVPAWRKELSERVREVQARKAREAELEEEFVEQPFLPMEDEATPALGLVPAPEVNPIVARALERIDNARRTVIVSRSNGGAALAMAPAMDEPAELIAPLPMWPMPAPEPIAEEEIETVAEVAAKAEAVAEFAIIEPSIVPKPQQRALVEIEPLPATTIAEPVEAVELVFPEVAPYAVKAPLPVIAAQTPTARASSALGLDDLAGEATDPTPVFQLRRHDEPIVDESASSLSVRAVAGVLDLMLVVFATSPFAAVIELMGGDWSNVRVWGSLLAITGIVLVLYQACAVALSGRTWAMSLFSLRVADAEFGSYPNFKQSLVRSFVFLFSTATAGLPFLFAFFNRDRQTAHDRLSGTTVVRGE